MDECRNKRKGRGLKYKQGRKEEWEKWKENEENTKKGKRKAKTK